MIRALAPALFDPLTAHRNMWSQFHELRRINDAETSPGDPVMPDDLVEAIMKRPDPFEFRDRYVIASGEEMLSLFRGVGVTPANPEYTTNKHLYWAGGFVRPDRRRQGIARLWLPLIAELMDSRGATVLGFSAQLESGHAFLKWLGAAPKLTEIESRLDLTQVDWGMVERWVREGQERSPNTRLEVYHGPLPEAMWPEFAVQRTLLENSVPTEDLDMGDEIVTPERMREWYERQAAIGEVGELILTREPDGSMSAMTDVGWAPFRRTHIHQMLTAVTPNARGRGLGKWIKAAMLLHLRELYPDALWIVTGNARSNAAMLGINRALGFKPFRSSTEYQISRAALGTKIKAL